MGANLKIPIFESSDLENDLAYLRDEHGVAIIIISHRLEDIHRVGDRVVVLRHGRKVADRLVEGDIHEFREQVDAYMVGARDDYRAEPDPA